jgi:[ribosomal protein S5]-alanine N-acetyltransferase
MADEIMTERLHLRRARMSDLAAIHGLLSDPRNMRFWSSPPHGSLQQSEAWLRSMVEADAALSDDFVIERHGRVIGKLGCWQLPEVGFMIAFDETGQGYATEAMAAFLERRRQLGEPRRLTADVDPRNEASLRLLARHGFFETGREKATWTVGGEVCDSVYLALDL